MGSTWRARVTRAGSISANTSAGASADIALAALARGHDAADVVQRAGGYQHVPN